MQKTCDLQDDQEYILLAIKGLCQRCRKVDRLLLFELYHGCQETFKVFPLHMSYQWSFYNFKQRFALLNWAFSKRNEALQNGRDGHEWSKFSRLSPLCDHPKNLLNFSKTTRLLRGDLQLRLKFGFVLCRWWSSWCHRGTSDLGLHQEYARWSL